MICDLDGTLLDDDPKLPPSVARRLNELIDAGLAFTFASARSVHIARALLGDLRPRLPVIEYNGAFITDFASGEKLVENPLLAALTPALADLAARHALEPMMFCRRDAQDLLLAPKSANAAQRNHLEFLRRRDDVRLQHGYTTDDWQPNGNLIWTFSGTAAEIGQLARAIPPWIADLCDIHQHADPHTRDMQLLMVQDRNSTKLAASQRLAALLQRSMRDVVAFGDQVNDISLLTEAGWGVAVANAAPEVERVADEVCGPNTDAGVVAWLEAMTKRSA